MKARMQGVTPAQLRQMAENDPSVQVMEAVHDNIFEPWDPRRLRSAIDQVAQTACKGGKGAVDALLERDANLRSFARLHPMIFSKVSDPNFAADPARMKVFFDMLRMRTELQSGSMSEAQARERVAEMALKATPRVPSSSASATVPLAASPVAVEEDEPPRIVELP